MKRKLSYSPGAWCLMSLVLAVISFVVPTSADEATPFSSLRKSIRAASHGTAQLPSAGELVHARTLFESTLNTQGNLDDLRRRWAELEMELTEVTAGDQALWMLRETPHTRRGRGIYLFRTGTQREKPAASSALALQAPHSFYDQRTREIVLHLFLESNAEAAGWNTLHRSKVDLAHTDAHYFNEFTRAFARKSPHALVAQLHGFSQSKHPDLPRQALVVSSGQRYPAPRSLNAARAFASRSWSLRVYPTDLRKLGGTTNAQSHVIRQVGAAFLHLELSAPLRDSLQRQPLARSEFLKALEKSHRLLQSTKSN